MKVVESAVQDLRSAERKLLEQLGGHGMVTVFNIRNPNELKLLQHVLDTDTTVNPPLGDSNIVHQTSWPEYRAVLQARAEREAVSWNQLCGPIFAVSKSVDPQDHDVCKQLMTSSSSPFYAVFLPLDQEVHCAVHLSDVREALERTYDNVVKPQKRQFSDMVEAFGKAVNNALSLMPQSDGTKAIVNACTSMKSAVDAEISRIPKTRQYGYERRHRTLSLAQILSLAELPLPTLPPSPARVLKLPGGGIRGLFVATVLVEMESIARPRQVRELFDHIVGNGTGALMAAMLCQGIPASVIRDFYQSRMPLLFAPGPGAGIHTQLLNLAMLDTGVERLLQSTHSNAPLHAACSQLFGTTTVGDLSAVGKVGSGPHAKCHILALQLGDTPRIVDFGNMEHDEKKVADCVAAAAAVLTYNPPYVIDGHKYADVGLLVPHPAAVALQCPAATSTVITIGNGRFPEDLCIKLSAADNDSLTWCDVVLPPKSIHAQDLQGQAQLSERFGPRSFVFDFDLDKMIVLDQRDICKVTKAMRCVAWNEVGDQLRACVGLLN